MKLIDGILRTMGYHPAAARRNPRAPLAQMPRTLRAPRARAYNAGAVDRLTNNWSTAVMSMDSELSTRLRNIRARSRVLEQNNDYARKFLGMCVTNVVGPAGVLLKNGAMQPDGTPDKLANKIIENEWWYWGRCGVPTVDGRHSWLSLQQLGIKTIARDGEMLLRLVRGYPNRWGLALQLIEIDHLDEDHSANLANGNRIRMGIEFNEWNRPVAYHVRTRHPGDLAFGGYQADRVERIPASEIIHPFITERINQSRGLPWMVTAMTRLNNLGAYEEAEIIAARVAASKMGFFEQEMEGSYTGEDRDDADNVITEVEPGSLEALPPGMKFNPFTPDHPAGNFGPFIKATLRGIASGMAVSYNSLAADLESVNYSSMRAGTVEERDAWRIIQTWMVDHFHQPVFEAWLDMAMLTKAVNLPVSKFQKFNAAAWHPRGWDWVDPAKDMQANAEAVRNGFRTRTQVLAEAGLDLEETLQQLAEEEKLIAKYGLKLGDAAKPAGAPAPAAGEK